MKLSRQILAVNAVLITATVLAASTVARLHVQDAGSQRQSLVLVAAILATVLVNGIVLRRRFAPLESIIDTMERVELSEPGRRSAVTNADSEEVVRLHHAFNRMLDRLELERRQSSEAVLRAQEAERARLARDLHDEANQSLTGVLLRLRAIEHDAPEQLRPELRETAEAATMAMDELLRLARELRPSALDDHGLEAALRTQVDGFARQTGVDGVLEISPDVGELGPDEQTVVYRVVQESLSNVGRHAQAAHVVVEVGRDHGRPVVRVADDGVGFTLREARADGIGLVGMRERARLARGRLEVQSTPGRGTVVELRLDRDLWLADAA
jgi:two-component system, NarL family, sensor histidine kinase UhpB